MPTHTECDCSGCRLLDETIREIMAVTRSVTVGSVRDARGDSVVHGQLVCTAMCEAILSTIDEDYSDTENRMRALYATIAVFEAVCREHQAKWIEEQQNHE